MNKNTIYELAIGLKNAMMEFQVEHYCGNFAPLMELKEYDEDLVNDILEQFDGVNAESVRIHNGVFEYGGDMSMPSTKDLMSFLEARLKTA